jgi:hypothetical protein
MWWLASTSIIARRQPIFGVANVSARVCVLCLTGAVALLVEPSASHSQAPAARIEASPSGDEAQKVSPGTYRQIAPGLLGRTVFSTSQAGPVAVQIMDILVGPGKSATIPNIGFAALLEVEAGDARITLDDKAAAAGQTNVIAVSQGQTIGIDNSGDARSFVARLIRLSVPAQ